jgi:hypothetical protein
MENISNIGAQMKKQAAQVNPQKREGKVASMIEEQTAKIPSDIFLWASLGAMTASLAFKIFRRDETSLFVGQWAPAFLLFGIYNKLVKQLGHDSRS